MEEHGGFPGYYALASMLTFYPWSALVPALLIAVLTVAVNLVADAVHGSSGVSVDSGGR